MSAVLFDEAKHEYRKPDGTRLPSVTEILKPLYADLRFVKQDLLDWKSEVGVAVHKAIELYTLKQLDLESIDDIVRPYFVQFVKFCADTGFVPNEAEVRVSSLFGYAGTLDLIGVLNGRKVLVDIKTTAALSPAVALQTAAYATAYNSANEHAPVRRRYALRLTPELYRLQSYDNQAADFAVFVALLKTNQWCQQNGAKQEYTHV
jgi:hypothetical protein